MTKNNLRISSFNRNFNVCDINKINIVNHQEKRYHDKRYKITISVSNTIAPTFIVYATDEQQAIDFLSDYDQKVDLGLFIDYYDLIDTIETIDELNHLHQAGNGLYMDLSYVQILTI